jgi:hypothetical protein
LAEAENPSVDAARRQPFLTLQRKHLLENYFTPTELPYPPIN